MDTNTWMKKYGFEISLDAPLKTETMQWGQNKLSGYLILEIRLLFSWWHFESIPLMGFSRSSKLKFDPHTLFRLLPSKYLSPCSSTKEDCGLQSKAFQDRWSLNSTWFLIYEWFPLSPPGLLKQILKFTKVTPNERGWEAWPRVSKVWLVIAQNHRDLGFCFKGYLCNLRCWVSCILNDCYHYSWLFIFRSEPEKALWPVTNSSK